MSATAWATPDWVLPLGVRALQTERGAAGHSTGPYRTFNLGTHVGDDPVAVDANRALLREAAALPSTPHWLQQVHGVAVYRASHDNPNFPPEADAAVTRDAGVVLAIMTADCLPLLLVGDGGRVVGAAHAGWRGLRAGVIEATLAAMDCAPSTVQVWLGPCIGPSAFEVGGEVRAAFIAQCADAAAHFVPQAQRDGHWLADLRGLARQRLQAAGVVQVAADTRCTVADQDRYFSYRRDGVTGRMASLIWRTS